MHRHSILVCNNIVLNIRHFGIGGSQLLIALFLDHRHEIHVLERRYAEDVSYFTTFIIANAMIKVTDFVL